MDETPLTPQGSSRRGFLLGGATAGAAAVIAAGRRMAVADDTSQEMGGVLAAELSPYGPNQRVLLNEPSRATAMISFDVIATGRKQLSDLFAVISDRVKVLAAGESVAVSDPSRPPADNGVLGPSFAGNQVGVLIGVGASLFDHRFGLAARKPVGLKPMRTFPNDNLDPAICHGDLSVQFTAATPDVVTHALRDLTKHTRGAMQPRWRVDGFTSPPRPDGAPRNLLGFKDGTSNPSTTDTGTLDRLIWTKDGGSFQVVRIIRNLVEFWDRVSLQEQELMIGRRRDDGSPLDADGELTAPDYARDPQGLIIPTDAHIRLANPRTPRTEATRILRRSWNYDLGLDSNGQLNQGTLFTCYQQDIERQFEAVQTRLIDEPLTDYISPVGGGYFSVLPGLADRNDTYAKALLS
ncbi:iron-dependent peroxidase [Microlunatus endophyticus]|uniref:Iron-dependent peroxidase n=1 Tax=Microlunatus endophyticus TaxID=1716077 RepID=A0A917W0J5_9ACTN|nr:Dyp-type peroxidase [Microlunatus endophyticus]GGL52378.1 iron-dependent peroxidase [Microlunatus endophyticus]